MKKKTILLLLICQSVYIVSAQQTVDGSFSFNTKTEYQKGLAYISAFQYEQAISHFYECQRNEPNNLEYLSKLAWCYLQTGNYSESKLYFQKVLKNDPQHVVSISNLGYLFEKELNYIEAQKYYRQLIQIDTTNSYYYRLNAFNLLKTNNVLQGLAYFNKAHTLNPKDLVVINELSDVYFDLDALEYAETMVEKGLELSPDNLRLLYTNARIQNKKKAYPEVITLLEKTQMLRDTHPYYQTILGVAYLHLGSIEKAIFQLEHIVNQDKATEHAHHFLSIAYDEKGDIQQSMHHLEKTIGKAISPKISTYYEELATHYDKRKDYKAALSLYEEAYAHSEDATYLFYIARNTDLYYKDKGMAQRLYQKYLASGHKEFKEYSVKRIAQLKEIIHLSKN